MCRWSASGTTAPYALCPPEGLVNPANALSLQKPSPSTPSGSWSDWFGTDAACVDYALGARGKWNSATSVKGGLNVTMADSIQAACAH